MPPPGFEPETWDTKGSDCIRRLDILTRQCNCAYFGLYKILDEGEQGKTSSIAISESQPEPNGNTLGHSGSRRFQERTTVR
ncbi:hypothetical protein CEXT_778011 [Caerostris extrusa]|uniref:Uncharacterized protein n=1 Tax=Caerostris extrusa TaxID=172846 RepID=A0AAV4RBH4_CAEEX|nr:hypothetical protein CEXT_778011 [Caerostris extrusa]